MNTRHSACDPAASSPIMALAQFVSEASFDVLPDSVVDATKLLILDNVGCAIVRRASTRSNQSSAPAGSRDQHIAAISRDGQMKWQVSNGDGKRSLVETAMGRPALPVA